MLEFKVPLPPETKSIESSRLFNVQDVENLHKTFKELAVSSENPNEITALQLKEALAVAGVDWGDDTFVASLFPALDTSHSGGVDFREFVVGLSVLSQGTPRQKLDFTFTVYDTAQTGSLSQQELVSMLRAANQHKGQKAPQHEVTYVYDIGTGYNFSI